MTYPGKLILFDEDGRIKSDLIPQGMEGKSAYEIAVDNSFIGTEQEWLNSLIGKNGLTGSTGDNGFPGIQGTIGNNGPTGPQGISGLKGNTGTQGLQGLQGIQGIKGNTGTSGDGLSHLQIMSRISLNI